MRLYIFLFLIMPSTGLALTTEQYLGLVPELMQALSSARMLDYTVITASLVAFYLFGWSASWLMRIGCFVIVFCLFVMTFRNTEEAFNTLMEAQYLWKAEIRCNDVELNNFYSKIPSELRRWGDLPKEISPEGQFGEYWCFENDAVRDFYLEGYMGVGLLGRGMIGGKIQTNNPLKMFGIFTWDYYYGFVFFFSMLIWLIFPSRQFFEKRGWIDSIKA